MGGQHFRLANFENQLGAGVRCVGVLSSRAARWTESPREFSRGNGETSVYLNVSRSSHVLQCGRLVGPMCANLGETPRGPSTIAVNAPY